MARVCWLDDYAMASPLRAVQYLVSVIFAVVVMPARRQGPGIASNLDIDFDAHSNAPAATSWPSGANATEVPRAHLQGCHFIINTL
jgi:hypothetical protein